MLRDPKLERFAQHLLSNIAAGMTRGKAATEAARSAGYEGKSLAANARKRAQRKDVKARVAELAAPQTAQALERIEATKEWATDKLTRIASPDLDPAEIAATDQIAAIKLLAQINGWMAPKEHGVTLRPTNQMTDDELARIAAGSSEDPAPAPAGP